MTAPQSVQPQHDNPQIFQGDPEVLKAKTIAELFLLRSRLNYTRPALEVKREGRFESILWSDFQQDVFRAADFLRGLVTPGARVVHIAENRYEWLVSDLAILALGGVHVPLHASLTKDQLKAQALDAEPCCIICSSSSGIPQLQLPTFSYHHQPDPECTSWHTAMREADPDQGRQAIELSTPAVKPDSLATILYTSGTTGDSKGVMLTHHNLTRNAVCAYIAFGITPEKKRLNFLPLSHIFARTCDFYSWMAGGYQLVLAESKDTVVHDCQATAPHIITGVPYFFERVHRSLQAAGIDQQPGALQKSLGGRVELCCSGGAPLASETYDYYASQGVHLLEGYGLTETSPVLTVNTPHSYRLGSVGQPLPEVHLRINQDGEILAAGPNIMLGYWRKPQATQQVLADGWFFTGDIGCIDDQGFLWITGRKKELIVTAGGKKIAPTFVESLLNRHPLIAQSLVYGDREKYLVALLVPNVERLTAQIAQMHLPPDCWQVQPPVPQVQELFQQAIDQQLSELSHYERVQKFCLLPQPFSVETGELTGKLSLRRSVITEKYAQQLLSLYR